MGEALKKQKKKKPGPKILLSKFLEFSGRTAVESLVSVKSFASLVPLEARASGERRAGDPGTGS